MNATDKASKTESGFWAIHDHTGNDYYTVLSRLQEQLQPKTYLEIGAMNGDTLALARCSSIAVDPKFGIQQDVMKHKPSCHLFQMKSDAFFSTHDPKALLGGAVEMAFLNGQNLFESVLRDFLNVEKNMKRNSIILLHGCIPTDAHVGRRLAQDQTFAGESRHPEWWAGDVWKAIAALKKFRPDLRIHAFNASPTGLAAITNLSPASEVLAGGYFDIVAQFVTADLGEYGVEKYLTELKVRDTSALAGFEAIAELFWL